MTHPLYEALDRCDPDGGTVDWTDPRGRTVVECEAVDRIGVRVRRVRVEHAVPRDLGAECERLAHALRHLPEDVVPTEVDPTLGGGVLRTDPDQLEDAFSEVAVTPGATEVTRHRLGPDGARQPTPWDTTREQLARVVDALRGHSG